MYGRSPERRIEPSPWWAYAGAYLAVAGTAARLSRLFDQWTIGEPLFDGPGVGFKVFVGGMVLAGAVLPLALAHRWGRIWPGWMVPWAGRDVPRWLVLGLDFSWAGNLSAVTVPSNPGGSRDTAPHTDNGDGTLAATTGRGGSTRGP